MANIKILSCVCLATLALCSCTNFLSRTELTRNIVYTDTGVNKPDVFPILRSTGYALVSNQRGATRNQKMLNAMRASKLDAYKELTEQVYGVYVKSHDKVLNNVHRQDSLETQIDGVVHGARVIRQYPVGDSYVTELELDTKLIYEMYQMRNAL